MLCEFLFFSLQLPHLCNMKQNGYQNAAFGCFVLMPFYDIVSFTAATTITGIPSSLSATLHSFWLAIFSPHPLQNRKRHDITWPEEPKWSFGWWTSLAFTDYETEQLHKALLWLPRRCGDWFSLFPIRSRLGSCIRRCWKHWCTALAGSYLNTQKGRRNAAFPRYAG